MPDLLLEQLQASVKADEDRPDPLLEALRTSVAQDVTPKQRIAAATAELEARGDERFAAAPLRTPPTAPPPGMQFGQRILPLAETVGTFDLRLKQPGKGPSKLDILNEFRRAKNLPDLDELPSEETLSEFVGRDVATADGLQRRIPFVGGFFEAADLYRVLGATQRIEEGEATSEDVETLATFQERLLAQAREKTFGADVAQIISESIPFMVEFLGSGGAIAAIKGGGKKVAKKAVKRRLSSAISKVLEKSGTAGAGRIAVSTAERLPFFSARFAAGTVRNLVPNFDAQPGDEEGLQIIIAEDKESLGKAVRDAGVDLAVEIYSEQTGIAFAGIGRVARKALGIKPVRIGAREFLSRAGFHGVVGEIGEERIGELMREAATRLGVADLPQEVPTGRQLATEAAAFAAVGGAGAVVDLLANVQRPDAVQPQVAQAILQQHPETGKAIAAEEQPTRRQEAVKELRKILPQAEVEKWSGDERKQLASLLRQAQQEIEDAGEIREAEAVVPEAGAQPENEAAGRGDVQQAALARRAARDREAQEEARVPEVVTPVSRETAKRGFRPMPQESAGQKARKELGEAMDELGGYLQGRTFASPVDPKLLKLAVNVVAKSIKAGVLTLNDIMTDVARRFGRQAAETMRPVIRAEWDKQRGKAVSFAKGFRPTTVEIQSEVAREIDTVTSREPAVEVEIPVVRKIEPTQEELPAIDKDDAAPVPALMDKWLADRDESNQEAVFIAQNNQARIKKLVGTKRFGKEAQGLDMAIMVYIDLKGHEGDVETFEKSLNRMQRKLVEDSQNLSEAERALADEMIEQNLAFGIAAKERGVIANYLDNYTARIWNFGTGKKGEQQFAKFKTKTHRSKPRVFGSILEGWSQGYNLRVKGATNAQLLSRTQVGQVIVDRNLIEMGKKARLLSHTQQPDWKIVEHPNFKAWRHSGTLEEGSAVYDRDLFLAPNGDLFRRVPLFAEPGLAEALRKVLGKSALLRIPGVRFATKWNAIIKHTILMSAFFHHQAFLRSSMLGSKSVRPIESFRQGRDAIMNFTPELRELVRGGLTIGRMQDWDEWILHDKTLVGKAIDRVPAARQIKDHLVDMHDRHVRFLFQTMGANLKVQAGLLEYRDLLGKNKNRIENGEIARHELAKLAAQITNDDFGGLNLARMGRDPTKQHIFQLLLLAPDWTESNVRSMVRAFKAGREGEVYRAFWGRIVLKGLLTTIMFNLVMAGWGDGDDDRSIAQRIAGDFWKKYQKAWKEGHLRWLDIDVTPMYRRLGGDSEKDKYFSLVGHFRDPLKFIVSPFVSAKHKGSVLTRMFIESMTGTDWASRRFTTLRELLGIDDKGLYKTTVRGKHEAGAPKGGKLKGRLVAKIRGGRGLELSQLPSFLVSQLRSAMPIPIQQAAAYIGGEIDGFDALGKSFGAMVSTTYPPAAKQALDEAIEAGDAKQAKAALQRLFREGAASEEAADIAEYRRFFLTGQLRFMSDPSPDDIRRSWQKNRKGETQIELDSRMDRRRISIAKAKAILDISEIGKGEALQLLRDEANRRHERTAKHTLRGVLTAFGRRERTVRIGLE